MSSWYPTTDYKNEQNEQDFDNQYDSYAPAQSGLLGRQRGQWDQSGQSNQWDQSNQSGQSNQWADAAHSGRPINIGGRRCRIVCDRSPPRPRPHPGPRPWPRPHPGPDRDRIRQLILNRTINEARRLYPNIRVVRENGRDLVVTQDYRGGRANVEVRNGIVVRFFGFY